MDRPNALAYVSYKYFKTSPENQKKFGRVFWYLSKKPRVRELVGNGGTLWAVTSRKHPRQYSLAFRLANCMPYENIPSILKDEFGKFGVIGTKITHYPTNYLNYVLLSLRFSPCKPIQSMGVIGNSIQTARCLSEADVVLLKDYANMLEHRRSVFISYSHSDRNYALKIENRLEKEGISVWRDVRSIAGGKSWHQEIMRAINSADYFLLLQSEAADRSPYVLKEIEEALKIVGKPGKLKGIIPIVISATKKFQKLNHLHRLQWGEPSAKSFLDRLVGQLYRGMVLDFPSTQ